jgi:hypothetical protein
MVFQTPQALSQIIRGTYAQSSLLPKRTIPAALSYIQNVLGKNRIWCCVHESTTKKLETFSGFFQLLKLAVGASVYKQR